MLLSRPLFDTPEFIHERTKALIFNYFEEKAKLGQLKAYIPAFDIIVKGNHVHVDFDTTDMIFLFKPAPFNPLLEQLKEPDGPRIFLQGRTEED